MVTAPTPSQRREAFRAATSVALAVLIARLLQLPDIWWVAFSAFMVARPGFFITLQRGIFRILGTGAGAVAGVWLAALLADHTIAFVLFMFASSVPTLYLTLVSRSGYGWLFAAITIDMVLAAAHLNPGGVTEFARLRVLDVVVGTLAALAVSFAFDHGNSLRRAGWQSAWVGLVPPGLPRATTHSTGCAWWPCGTPPRGRWPSRSSATSPSGSRSTPSARPP